MKRRNYCRKHWWEKIIENIIKHESEKKKKKIVMWLGGWKGGMFAEKGNFKKKKNERTRKRDRKNERKTTNVKGYLIL